MARQFHPDKDKHSQFSDVMKMINEAKEELEDALRHNDAMSEQERFCMEHNNIVISSDSSSSYNLLETSSDDWSDSGTRKIPNQTSDVI